MFRHNRCFLLFFCIVQWSASSAQQTPSSSYSSYAPINYIRAWEPVRPYNLETEVVSTSRLINEVRQTTQYFDGLGRPLQTIIKQGSMQTGQPATDLVSPVIYDELGREQLKYLPYASTESNGNFKINPFQQQVSFYNAQLNGQLGETNVGANNLNWAYSKTNFEASPLNRITATFAPGASWVGSEGTGTPRPVKMNYWINKQTDSVRIWNVTDAVQGAFGTYSINTLVNNGIYPAGELFKNITEDEHGKQVVEFKDKEGKVILKKVQLIAAADNGSGSGYSGWICTYYIYDDLNRLRCVVQPEGVKLLQANSWNINALSGVILFEQCFRYEYDGRNRMIMKKVPGAGPVFMVYDARDRLVLTQDSLMRLSNKWLQTKYDQVNRPFETGLLVNTTSFTTHLAVAAASSNYQPAGTYELLTYTNYDNYNSLPAGLSSTLLTNWNSHFASTSNTWPYPEMPAQSNAVTGMVTWTQVKILNSSPAKFIYSVSIYDAKGRVIQVQSKNELTGGVDVSTTQYSWAGQPLVSVLKAEKSGTNAQTTVVVTQFSYDDLGRLVKTEKRQSNTNVNSNSLSSFKTIAELKYDKLGQLTEKKLAPYFNSNQGLETQAFEYNIRGWMLGVNRSYTRDASSNNYFGFDLGYDKQNNNLIGGQAYAAAQFNGNIAGMVWKTRGDGEKRKYDFAYDAANRLLRADFGQYTSNSFSQTAGINYNVKMGDGSNVNTAYDYNGNILQMQQWGWKPGGSAQIDDLRYQYLSSGNRLRHVSDIINSSTSKLGDFKDGTNGSNPDYSYDGNGNLTADANKSITSISYNHLNLPSVIITAKGNITYTYDAAGNKLQKQVAETGLPVKTTLYAGALVYENDTLQFAGMEEGRIRPSKNNGTMIWAYDYMLKDHLGNVRMVLTDEAVQSNYPAATLENVTYNNGTAISVEEQFYAITPGNVVNQSVASGIPAYPNNNGNPPWNPNNPHSNTGANSGRLYLLNATNNTNENKTGLGIALKVMAGDKFSVYCRSYHKRPAGGYSGTTNSIIVSELINAFAGRPSILSKGITGAQISGQPGFPTSMNGLIGSQPPQGTGLPKAAVNWILFDEQFKFVTGGFDMVGDAGSNTAGTFKTHSLLQLPVAKNGYLYVYVSNESKTNVFFDNLQVIHDRGPIVEETHYYPFGLTMAGISSKAAGSLANKKKYNGIEFENDLDLNTYDAFFRELDPQIGRWWQIDPKTEDMEQWSPYVSNYDNPITYTDPLGDEPDGDGPGDPPSTATRIWGAVKAVGGLTEMVVGAVGGTATSWTGVGAVFGGAAVVHGADNFVAGVTQLFTGNSTQTITEQGVSKGLKSTGVSEQKANTIAAYTDVGISVVLTAGAGAGANSSKVGTVVPKSTSTINAKGLGNPFKNSTLKEVRNSFEKRVSQGTMEKKGPNAYVNKKSGYSYNIDKGGNYGRGGKKVEKPHIDVNYPNPKPKNVPPKKKLDVSGE